MRSIAQAEGGSRRRSCSSRPRAASRRCSRCSAGAPTTPRRPPNSRCSSSGQEKPVHLAKAAGGTYRVPAKLKPETEYAWTVTSAGNEIGTGKFRTLSQRRARPRSRSAARRSRAEFSDRAALHADAAGDGRDAGSARIVGAPRAGARRPARARRAGAGDARALAALLLALVARGSGRSPVAFVADIQRQRDHRRRRQARVPRGARRGHAPAPRHAARRRRSPTRRPARSSRSAGPASSS